MSVARNPLPALFVALMRQAHRRVATKAARFRLAVVGGFVIATVGFLVVAADQRAGIAESIFGIEMPGLFQQAPQPQQAYSPQYAPRRHAAAARKHVHLARHEDAGDDKPMSLAGRSLCVRLCDGFAFPVGDYHGSGDRAAHEATCQSECPGAKTALFVVPAGSDSIGDATEVKSGRNYSEMPDAFHYTTYVNEACTCHPQGGNRIKSLLHDFTLRRGDSVMTARGLRVFHGGESFPFKRKDFVALERSRDIRKADRAGLRAIERASLASPTTVASVPATPRPQPMAAAGTKALQHEAQN